MKVKKHIAEKFIDWYPLNTKLYLRGERGKSQAEASAMREELFRQLVSFFNRELK